MTMGPAALKRTLPLSRKVAAHPNNVPVEAELARSAAEDDIVVSERDAAHWILMAQNLSSAR